MLGIAIVMSKLMIRPGVFTDGEIINLVLDEFLIHTVIPQRHLILGYFRRRAIGINSTPLLDETRGMPGDLQLIALAIFYTEH